MTLSGLENHGFVRPTATVGELRHRVKAWVRTDVLEVVPRLEMSTGEVQEVTQKEDGASIVRRRLSSLAPDDDRSRVGTAASL